MPRRSSVIPSPSVPRDHIVAAALILALACAPMLASTALAARVTETVGDPSVAPTALDLPVLPTLPAPEPGRMPAAPAPGLPAPQDFNPFAEWEPLGITARADQAAAFDPVHHRLLVFGGSGDSGYLRDLEALSLGPGPRWSHVPASDAAASGALWHRDRAAAVYDEANDRFVLYGGFSQEPVDGPPGYVCLAYKDLWMLDHSDEAHWKQISAQGEDPGYRFGHAAVYDRVHRRMLVWGGIRHEPWATYCWTNTPLQDLWELSLDDNPTWHELVTSGDPPTPGAGRSAVIDPDRRRLLVVHADTVWALPLDGNPVWQRIVPDPKLDGEPSSLTRSDLTAGPLPGPDSRTVFDPARDRLVAVEGSSAWELPLADPHWSAIEPSGEGPGVGAGFSLVWDTAGDRALLFGGHPAGVDCPRSDETWQLTFDGAPAWSLVPEERPGLVNSVGVYDSRRDRLIAVGGYGDSRAFAFSLAPPQAWSRLNPTGIGPLAGLGRAGIYDPVRDRVLVTGGGPSQTVPGDATVWQLTLGGTPAWSTVYSPSPERPQVHFPAVAYDSKRDRMLLYGGSSIGATYDAGQWLSATWELDLAVDPPAWQRIETGAPGPRLIYPSAAYDSVRDRLIVMGSSDYFPPGTSPLWALDLSGTPAWHLLVNQGEGSVINPLAYVPTFDAVMTFGYTSNRDALAFTFADSSWYTLGLHCCGSNTAVPPGRVFNDLVYEPVRNALVTFGGVGILQGCPATPRDVWALRLGPEYGPPPPPPPPQTIAVDIRPGSEVNPVNPGSHGVLPTAILGAPDFDATRVDPTSVTLAGAPVRVDGAGVPMAHSQDVNGDGLADLVVQIETDRMALAVGDTVAWLYARDAEGNEFVGHDRVRIVPRAGAGAGALAASEVAGAQPATLAIVRLAPAAGGGLRVGFTAPGAGGVRLTLLDLAGRRLDARLERATAGTAREVVLAPGRPLAPGVYFVRLEQAGRSLTRKAAVAE